MPSRPALTFLSSLLLLGLTSCGPRVSQCKQLIDTISEGQTFGIEYERSIKTSLAQFSSAQNLPDLKAAATAHIATLQKASTQSSALAQDLSSLTLEDPQLNEYRERYTAVTTQWSVALTTAQEAAQLLAEAESEEFFRAAFGRFQAKTDSAYSAIQAIDSEESQLIEGIGSYCSSADS
ncbi:MAG: hypothetical protein AAFN12_06905 [Cyanobacteria bacterium J06560_2]